MKKKLFIFSNEVISSEDGKFYCDNIDLKSTPEGLNKKFEVNLFARKSKKKRSHEIKLKKLKYLIIYFLILSQYKLQKRRCKIFNNFNFTIYIYNFFIFKILGKKPIVYLRSDGYGEYRAILGKVGPIIYHFMFTIVLQFLI